MRACSPPRSISLFWDGRRLIPTLDRKVLIGSILAARSDLLRDKVSYLAARPEIYGPFLVIFLFPIHNMIVASQFVFLCIWLGAASSVSTGIF